MLLFRACVLATLVCVHVLGGAVLFRRLFPRESPWWGFFLPVLLLVSTLNFIEHLVALPMLVGALPFTTCGSILAMVCFRGWRKSLRLPIALFVPTFLFCFSIKCLQPNINYYNTEGLTDLNRILDFCLGDTVPPQDCWLPPYPHTGYYTFMHYGASVLKRLLFVDIGTACNVSSALVSSLNMLAGAAAAYTLGRFRPLIAVLTLIVLAGGFTGSMPIHAVLHPLEPNPVDSIYLGDDIDGTHYKEFAPLLRLDAPYNGYRVFTPGCYIYYPEFHAPMGGDLVTLLTVFSVAEVLRRRRSFFPWIFLMVAPVLVFISCTWLVFIVMLLAIPSLIYSWKLNRRPPQWRPVFLGAGIWLLLLAPTLVALLYTSNGQTFHFSRKYPRDFIIAAIQWWPVYLPWLALFFRWEKLNRVAHWLHFWLVPIALSTETIYFSYYRTTFLEKTLGAAYGVGITVVLPLLFVQSGRFFRGLSGVVIFAGVVSITAWTVLSYTTAWGPAVLHLEGDHFLQEDPVENTMEQTLKRIHGQTVLAGNAQYAWFGTPALAAFTENRCYLGWTNAEETAGHPAEADFRQKQINDFFEDDLPDPLRFLQDAGISAVIIWPEDQISDARLDVMKSQLRPAFSYIDCRTPGTANAGIFVESSLLPLGSPARTSW